MDNRWDLNKKVKCKECYDTGCSCGGIGLSCHGCCSCEAGEKAQQRRNESIAEVYMICTSMKGLSHEA